MCITIENSPRIMAAVIVKWIILICVLSAFESVVEGTAGTFDYIVDCSACQAGNFIKNVASYRCAVRCQADGQSDLNLTRTQNLLIELMEKLENTTNKLQKALEEIDLLKKDISFAVTPSNQVTYSDGHILKFDKIINNNGNAYNPTTGTFTAPFNGTYEFSIVMLNANNGYAARAQLMLNGERQCFSYAGTGIHSTGRCHIVIQMAEGDELYALSDINNGAIMSWFSHFSGQVHIN